MAIPCKYCGTELPRDDARFCNNCGMLVPFLREQVAFLPPVHPARPSVRNGPPSWAGQHKLFERGEQENKEPPDMAMPEPQEKLPETPRPERHEDEAEEKAVPESEEPDENALDVEDLPTRRIEAVNQADAKEQSVELLPTSPLELSEIERSKTQESPTEEPPTSPLPLPFPVQEEPVDVATREDVVRAPARSRTRGRLPILIVAILLASLIIGGVGTWVVAAQPFSVAPITRPQLDFSNPQLGISLSYPNGWTQQIDSNRSAIHFYASSHTAEVDINVADAGDVNRALQQQATKLGLSGTKAGAALPFAGTTWQQLQGSLQQSGANYTVTLLAAVHRSHLFTIVQQAPQSNYADWEKEFFSPLRGTLKFL